MARMKVKTSKKGMKEKRPTAGEGSVTARRHAKPKHDGKKKRSHRPEKKAKSMTPSEKKKAADKECRRRLAKAGHRSGPALRANPEESLEELLTGIDGPAICFADQLPSSDDAGVEVVQDDKTTGDNGHPSIEE